MSECSIHELKTADLEEAVQFTVSEIRKFRGSEPADPVAHLASYRWLFIDNPRRTDDFIGWGLRTPEGKLVGTHLIAWQHYTKAGNIARALVSTNSYVNEAYRGPKGLGLMLNMRKREDADLCMCTTANINSGSIWKSMKGKEFYGSATEWLVPVNYLRLVFSMASRKAGNNLAGRVLSFAATCVPNLQRKLPSSLISEVLNLDAIHQINATPATESWEPLRTQDYLVWRYIKHPSGKSKLIRITKSGTSAELFVGVFLTQRGVKGEVRCLNVIDLFGAVRDFSLREVLGTLIRVLGAACDVVSIRLLASKLWEAELPSLAKQRNLPYPSHWGQSRKVALDSEDWLPALADGDASC